MLSREICPHPRPEYPRHDVSLSDRMQEYASAVNTRAHTHHPPRARAAAALGTRHSPRPLVPGGTRSMRNPGVSRRGIAKLYVPGSIAVNRVFNQKCPRGESHPNAILATPSARSSGSEASGNLSIKVVEG